MVDVWRENSVYIFKTSAESWAVMGGLIKVVRNIVDKEEEEDGSGYASLWEATGDWTGYYVCTEH